MKHTQDGISCLKALKQKVYEDDQAQLADVAINQIQSYLPTLAIVAQYLERTSPIAGTISAGLGVIQFADKAMELTEQFERKHRETDWEEKVWDETLYEWLISKENKALKSKVHSLFFN